MRVRLESIDPRDLRTISVSAWPDGRMMVRLGRHEVTDPAAVRAVLAAVRKIQREERRPTRAIYVARGLLAGV